MNGIDVNQPWSDQELVPSYLSVALAGIPNCLTLEGASFPSAHGSFFPLIEKFSDFTLQVLQKMQVENIKYLKPNIAKTRQFLLHANTFLKRTVWTGPCSSWFKGGKTDGKPALWPGSRLHFMKLLETPRMENYDIE